MLSTEAIYLWLYEQKKKGNDLTNCLRRRHRRRRKRRLAKQPRTLIKDKVSIHQRPEEVNAEARLGDMETDLVKCKGGYVVTITERKSLFNLLAVVRTKSADAVSSAIVSLLTPFKEHIHSLTSDNGTEFAQHKQTAERLNIPWFFCDPYRSQQRGRNENQNGLVRQYLTRNTDLSTVTEQQLKCIQDKLNNRPRKKNNFQSPKAIFLNPHPNYPVALVT
jgi:IS30 family transposase